MTKDKKPTYYEFFGLRNFEPDPIKIKGAYRAMALKHHPDRCQDKVEAERVMKQVNEVYLVLCNHKADYDDHLRKKLNTQDSGQYSANFWNKHKNNYGKEFFEDMQPSFSFKDFSGFSTQTTRDMTAELRKKLRIKKFMDTLSEEELSECEIFINIRRERQKR